MTEQTQTNEPVGEAISELTEFDINLQHFLDPMYSGPEPVDEPVVAAGDPDPAAAKPEGVQQPAAVPSPVPAPSNAPVVEPVAEVKPELLAQFFTDPTKPAVQATPVAEAAPSPAPAQQQAVEKWIPFQTPIDMPPQLTAALFESDDPQVRAQALGVVINSIGNSIAQLVEQRFHEVYAPRLQQQSVQAVQQQNQVQTIDNDFYGTYPELSSHRDVVRKAFQIVANSAGADAKYDVNTKTQVGNLARAALKQLGIQVQQQPAPQPTPAPAPKKQPFVAGGARPGDFQAPSGAMTPESLLADLSQF